MSAAIKYKSDYFDLLAKTLIGSIYPESANRLIEAVSSKGIRNRFRNTVIGFVGRFGYKVYRNFSYDPVARDSGEDWPSIAYSMIGAKRMHNLHTLSQKIIDDGIKGDFIECGVWRGGAAIMMQAVLNANNATDTRSLWLADSFEGLPAPTATADDGYDVSGYDYLSVGEKVVLENFERFGLLKANVKPIRGWFENTLPVAPIEKIALLRADADLYSSTIDIFDNLYHKVVPGGFIIVDDYGNWEPCRKAVTDFRTKHGITEEIIEIDRCGIYWRVT